VILGFIHSSKEASPSTISAYGGSIGVRAYIVCDLEAPVCCALSRLQRDDNSRKHRKTQRMPYAQYSPNLSPHLWCVEGI